MASWNDENYAEKTERILGRIANLRNRETARRYLAEREVSGAVKPSSLSTDANFLRILSDHLGETPYEDATRERLTEFLRPRAETRRWRNVRKDGTEKVTTKTSHLKHSTRQQRRILLRAFYKWLKGNGEEYPPEVKHLKGGSSDGEILATDKVLEPDQVAHLIATTPDTQGQAILALLYESGFRAGELCALKIRSVRFTDYGAAVTIPIRHKGKVIQGRKRGSRFIGIHNEESVPYLRRWLAEHAFARDPDAPFFYHRGRDGKHRPLTPADLWEFTKRAEKRAGLSIGLHPHLLRHTSATEKARRGWTEREMCAYFGWRPGSDMPARYVHLTGGDCLDMDLQRRGKKPTGKEFASALNPRRCGRCGEVNPATLAFCAACQFPLSPKAVDERERERMADIDEAVARRIAAMMKDDLPQGLRKMVEADGGGSKV